MDDEIIPIILCGGSGTRLWPLSRKSYPKQFAPLMGDGSLFQQAATRLSGPGFGAPVVVTGAAFRFIVTQQLAEVAVDPGAVLIEPSPRNTAPALLAAALHAGDRDALMLAAPADHLIPDAGAFRARVAEGVAAAREGAIVTFGIAPDRPETGYGYLEPDGVPGCAPVPLRRFVEKPDEATARAMLEDGGYLWNAGLFLFTAGTLIDAFAAHAPDILRQVGAALDGARPDLGFLRLACGPWEACPDISIDYAIMEKAGDLRVLPYAGGWSDLGGWEAVYHRSANDADGVALHGPAQAIDCRDTLLRAENGGQLLVGLGLDDIVAVSMPDAVLVANRRDTHRLNEVVAAMRAEGVAQADAFPKSHRPWGQFETLTQGPRFHVKRIVVSPGGTLSLQSHMHRAEHWIVVAGTARVTIGEEVKLVAENESVFIPLGTIHRLENPGKLPVELIEVQTGAYLGEDDITRYDDVYAREAD